MINKLTMLFAVAMAIFFLGGLATTLTRSMMIGFYDVLPVYIFYGHSNWYDVIRSIYWDKIAKQINIENIEK